MELLTDKNKWEAGLSTRWAGRNLQYSESLVSTNATAYYAGNDGAPHGTLIVADRQTGGRGRSGRSWESPAGKNLYFSLLLRPEFPLEKASMLTLLMAHSVARSLESYGFDCKVGIKWPNDILANGRKVCGILTELRAEKGRISQLIIGVGINVKKQVFAEELAEKASSLEDEWKIKIDRAQLLCKIMKAFEEDYESFAVSGDLSLFSDYYHSRLLNRDAFVKVLDPQKPFEGIARGINRMGELLVECQDGHIESVYAGEVSVRGLQGYI